MPTPNFDRSQVTHLAKLAAISLSDAETESLARELAAIVAYVEELSAVDTSSVAGAPDREAGHPTWRVDEVRPGLSHEDALAAAPRSTETGFAVPGFVSTGGSGGGE
jgi:aspartyl-tRNA(Asn)/glutamyl-tRNA(Gln) amidotransferase subunit C